MRTLVVSGGTDGIGKGLALHYVGRGDTVLIVGRNEQKGRQFLSEIQEIEGKGDFIHADLSLISENRRVIREIRNRVETVDALVLCARHGHQRGLSRAKDSNTHSRCIT